MLWKKRLNIITHRINGVHILIEPDTIVNIYADGQLSYWPKELNEYETLLSQIMNTKR